jgi:pSer/pThr/pTyr-binding forkhead associated (FHA) protein
VDEKKRMYKREKDAPTRPLVSRVLEPRRSKPPTWEIPQAKPISSVAVPSRGAPEATTLLMPESRLVVIGGSLAGYIVLLSNSKLTLGRSVENDIMLQDEGVSRYHAVVEYLDDEYAIRDLNTLNGTRVNNRKIQKHILRPGDRIYIGQASFEFEASSNARKIHSKG